jgi:hypothetical protein
MTNMARESGTSSSTAPSVVITPKIVTKGQRFKVQASHFAPNAVVEFYFNTTRWDFAMADNNGYREQEFPTTQLALGLYSVIVKDAQGHSAGDTLTIV